MPKTIRRLDDGTPRATITPTVELNALAMKLGVQTYYLFDPRSLPMDRLAENMQYSTAPPMVPLSPHHHQHHMLEPQTNHYLRRNYNGFVPPNPRFALRHFTPRFNGQVNNKNIFLNFLL